MDTGGLLFTNILQVLFSGLYHIMLLKSIICFSGMRTSTLVNGLNTSGYIWVDRLLSFMPEGWVFASTKLHIINPCANKHSSDTFCMRAIYTRYISNSLLSFLTEPIMHSFLPENVSHTSCECHYCQSKKIRENWNPVSNYSNDLRYFLHF